MKLGKLSKAVKITDPLEMVGFIRTNGTQCQFVSMLTVTEPKMRKDSPYKGVVKVSRRNGLLNVNYNTSVSKRLAEMFNVPPSEVQYIPGETWFKHQKTEDGRPLPLVVNKNKEDGKIYVQYFPIRTSGTKYVMPNGEQVAEEKLEPFFYARAEKEVWKPATCVFHVANIKELRASRVIVQTEDTAQAEQVLAH